MNFTGTYAPFVHKTRCEGQGIWNVPAVVRFLDEFPRYTVYVPGAIVQLWELSFQNSKGCDVHQILLTPECSPRTLNSIFMLGGAPTAHEILPETSVPGLEVGH